MPYATSTDTDALLLTPHEVAGRAFAGDGCFDPARIDPSTLALAQHVYIEPAVGAPLLQALVGGRYPELKEPFASALAWYVRLLLIDELGAVVGRGGVVRSRGEGYEAVDAARTGRLRAAARRKADAWLRRALERIARHPECYPEYTRPAPDARCVAGGMIL